MAVIRYVKVTHIIKHGRKKNQAKNTYGAFIFIGSVEKYLTADGNSHLQIVKSNGEKALTDLEG